MSSRAPPPARPPPRDAVALLGPLHPWRGGLAQYLQLLGEALEPHAEVRAVTFTRQYPGFLFPGHEPAAIPTRRGRRSRPRRCSIRSGRWSWRRTAAHLERFAPGAWSSSSGGCRSSRRRSPRASVRCGARGTRVVLVCDNLVPHEPRFFDRTFTALDAAQLGRLPGDVGSGGARPRPAQARRAAPARAASVLRAVRPRPAHARVSARAALGLAGDVALFFGYVRHYKGLDTLLSAWPRCARAVPARRWSWRASSTRSPSAYHALARRRARGRCACWTATSPTTRSRRCSGPPTSTVLPYRSATQSGVTHVAYALGVPVIATASAASPRPCARVRPGSTCPPEDPDGARGDDRALLRAGPGARAWRRRSRRCSVQHSWAALARLDGGPRRTS